MAEEKHICCLCGEAQDHMVLSRKTGHSVCKECVEAAHEEMNLDEGVMQQAMMHSFIERELLGKKRDDDGKCNCPRCVYDKLMAARDGAEEKAPAQAFLAEPVSGTKH